MIAKWLLIIYFTATHQVIKHQGPFDQATCEQKKAYIAEHSTTVFGDCQLVKQ